MKEIVLGIIRKKKMILVINRAKKLNLIAKPCPICFLKGSNWALPGGRIEAGEGKKTAVAREIKQEVGMKVAVVKKIKSRIVSSQLKITYFECAPLRNQRINKVPNKETLEAYWVPAAIIPHLFGTNNMDREVIQWLQNMSQRRSGAQHQRTDIN